MSENDERGRRGLLKVLIGAGSVGLCGALVAPAAVFVAAPVRIEGNGGKRWVRTMRVDSIPEGQPVKVGIVADEHDAWAVQKNVQLGAAWLLRRGDKVTAWSTACPHLGCSINAEPEGKGFACPCHTSAFGADGKRVAGPAPRDMDVLETRIADGFVEVDFHKYRIGVPEKAEIS